MSGVRGGGKKFISMARSPQGVGRRRLGIGKRGKTKRPPWRNEKYKDKKKNHSDQVGGKEEGRSKSSQRPKRPGKTKSKGKKKKRWFFRLGGSGRRGEALEFRHR